MENLEAGILARVPRYGDRLNFFRHPTRDSLSDPHRNLSDQSRMRILRRTQHEVLFGFIQQVNEARVAMRYVDDEIDDLPQDLVEIQCGADRLADLMQDP